MLAKDHKDNVLKLINDINHDISKTDIVNPELTRIIDTLHSSIEDDSSLTMSEVCDLAHEAGTIVGTMKKEK